MARIHQKNDFVAAIFAARSGKIRRGGRPTPEAVAP